MLMSANEAEKIFFIAVCFRKEKVKQNIHNSNNCMRFAFSLYGWHKFLMKWIYYAKYKLGVMGWS